MKTVDVTGHRFGRLVVLNKQGSKNLRKQWLCQCDCGNLCVYDSHRLRQGNTTSCGCFRKEQSSENGKYNAVHGMSKTGTGKTWNAMIYRCYNPKAVSYPFYGGKGIKVCEFLRASPINLKHLIGERPKGLTIDRKDPLANYSCGQCAECLSNGWIFNIRWATATEQGRNKSNSRVLAIDGTSHCISEWEELFGLHRNLINQRLGRGWIGRRLLEPPSKNIKNQYSK